MCAAALLHLRFPSPASSVLQSYKAVPGRARTTHLCCVKLCAAVHHQCSCTDPPHSPAALPGTIISHNVPPYGRAGLYKQLAAVKDLVAEYREGGAEAGEALKGPIIEALNLAGLQQDCPYTGNEGEGLHSWACLPACLGALVLAIVWLARNAVLGRQHHCFQASPRDQCTPAVACR